MEEDSKRKERKALLGTILVFVIGLLDTLGYFDIKQTNVLPIENKYISEAVVKGNKVWSEKHYFTFKIFYREAKAHLSADEYDAFQVGDELLVTYRIPINLLREPYIEFIDIDLSLKSYK